MASDKTIRLLAKKLNASPAYLIGSKEDDKELDKQLSQLLQTIITDVPHTSGVLQSINLPIYSVSQELTYYCLKCSYLYKTKRLEEAEALENDYLQYLLPDSPANIERLTAQAKEAYYYYQGMRHFRNNQLKQSFSAFQKLLAFPLPKKVIGDLHYNLALISYREPRRVNAIEYGKRALEIYIDISWWYKVGETYNLLGAVFCELKQYREALNYLNKASDIADQMNLNDLIGRVHHNLGLVQKDLGKYDIALKHFKLAYDIQNQINDQIYLFNTMIELIGCHLKFQNVVIAKNLLKSVSRYLSSQKDYHELLSLQADVDLIERREPDYLKKKKQALSYFMKHGYSKEALGMNRALGNFYLERKKYKNAALYFKNEIELKEIIERRDN